MKKIKDLMKNRKVVGALCGIIVLAVAGVGYYQYTHPKFPVYNDVLDTSLVQEDSPLGAQPTVDVQTKTSTSKKTVKLSKASTRSYTKNLGTKTSTKTKTSTVNGNDVKVEEKTEITKKEVYKKGSQTKTVNTETTVTTTTTTTPKTTTSTTTDSGAKTSTASSSEADVMVLASGMDTRVLSAFTSLGFKVVIDPSFTKGDGYFDAKNRTITLRAKDRGHCIHELGHFLAFLTSIGSSNKTLVAAYNSEKSKFAGDYAGYAASSTDEYFAECTREFFTSSDTKSRLKKNCPDSYEMISDCVDAITSKLISKVARKYK